MDTLRAFARGEANRGKEEMVFDWIKAAEIISERNPVCVSAGLRDDWEWTGGLIFSHGKIVEKKETYTYLASTWAVPELDIDGDVIACWKMQSETPGWDAKTYWPDEARSIVEGAKL